MKRRRPLEVLDRLRRLEEQGQRLALHDAVAKESVAEAALRTAVERHAAVTDQRNGAAIPGAALDLTRYEALLALDLETDRARAMQQTTLDARRSQRETQADALGDAWRDRRAVEIGVQRLHAEDGRAEHARLSAEALELWMKDGGPK